MLDAKIKIYKKNISENNNNLYKSYKINNPY